MSSPHYLSLLSNSTSHKNLDRNFIVRIWKKLTKLWNCTAVGLQMFISTNTIPSFLSQQGLLWRWICGCQLKCNSSSDMRFQHRIHGEGGKKTEFSHCCLLKKKKILGMFLIFASGFCETIWPVIFFWPGNTDHLPFFWLDLSEFMLLCGSRAWQPPGEWQATVYKLS